MPSVVSVARCVTMRSYVSCFTTFIFMYLANAASRMALASSLVGIYAAGMFRSLFSTWALSTASLPMGLGNNLSEKT